MASQCVTYSCEQEKWMVESKGGGRLRNCTVRKKWRESVKYCIRDRCQGYEPRVLNVWEESYLLKVTIVSVLFSLIKVLIGLSVVSNAVICWIQGLSVTIAKLRLKSIPTTSHPSVCIDVTIKKVTSIFVSKYNAIPVFIQISEWPRNTYICFYAQFQSQLGEKPNLSLCSECGKPCIQFLSCWTVDPITHMIWGAWFPLLDPQAIQWWSVPVKNTDFSNIFIFSSAKHAFHYTLHIFKVKMKSLIHTWAYTM